MPAPLVHVDRGALAGHVAGDDVPVARDDVHHLERVLRLRRGDEVVVSDGAGWWAPGRYGDGSVRLAGAPEHEHPEQPAIDVIHGLPKGRKLDEVVRHLTELGVDRIRPVDAARSVVRLDGARAEKARARWAAVARAAASQSRRTHLPTMDPPRPLDEVLESIAGGAEGTAASRPVGVVAHVGGGPLAEHLDGAPWGRERVVVAVGPEGGWSEDEVACFARHGFHPVSLGRSVLRTEHAAPALVAVVAYALGRMV